LLSKLVICMWAPKPVTFFLTSSLNPVTIAVAKIIMAKPKAMPITAILTMGAEIFAVPSSDPVILRAIKSGAFKVLKLFVDKPTRILVVKQVNKRLNQL